MRKLVGRNEMVDSLRDRYDSFIAPMVYETSLAMITAR